MKIKIKINSEVILISLMALVSVICFIIHFFIEKNAHEIVVSLLDNIAFLFIQVIFITLFIERVLSRKEKQKQMEKMNMVIGVFYSEIGTKLISKISKLDKHVDLLRNEMNFTFKHDETRFNTIKEHVKNYNSEIFCIQSDVLFLNEYLNQYNDFLLRLLENPILLEHGEFSKLLLSVFNLSEELTVRTAYETLPSSDLKHLSIDIKRVYDLLIVQWIDYMKHLQTNFPFLFSFAIRTNPFFPDSKPYVNE